MPLRNEIRRGIQFLLSVQNADGGVPATKPGDVSGCWTTAEALDALLSTPYFPDEQLYRLRNMVEFLLESQLLEDDSLETKETSSPLHQGEEVREFLIPPTLPEATLVGGWPLVVSGPRPSTMTTGHCVAALARAQRIFHTNEELKDGIARAKEAGINWLHLNQNHDGGWGVEPAVGPAGKESRMISTTYALRGYFEEGYSSANSKDVREGIRFIYSSVNSDGGWGKKPGVDSNACNTARAVTALIRSGEYSPTQPIIKKAAKFITDSKPRNRLWELGTETYIVKGAPGQTIYNENAPFDVLEAYLRVGYTGPEVRELVMWYLKNQEDDGRWYLGSNGFKVRELSTWPTNEAIFVLDLACEKHLRHVFDEFQRKGIPKKWQRTLIVLSAIVVIQFLYIVGAASQAGQFWRNLSENVRQIILIGVLLAIFINIFSGFLSEWIRKLLERRRAK